MDRIGDRLIKARERRYDTASDAARAMNMPVPTYSGHENGSRGVTLDAAMRYAKFFRVSLDWLVFGKGAAPDETARDIEVPVLSWVSAGDMARDDVSDETLGTITMPDLLKAIGSPSAWTGHQWTRCPRRAPHLRQPPRQTPCAERPLCDRR